MKETEENSDEEGESVMEEEGDSFSMNPEEVNQAPAFVPVSLRSPAPVPAQVEETMEEVRAALLSFLIKRFQNIIQRNLL